MLQINKINIVIKTSNGNYGFAESFNSGLNFIASKDNTCGKSSILAAIYYCLGLEEIIGGKGEKVLTSAYKNYIEDGKQTFPVLESGVYLELYNGVDTVTIYRSAKKDNRDSKLITAYYSSMELINLAETEKEDMYVHMPNSAINKKGFHSFLEKYIGLDLPMVPTSDDLERKLYLQLIFSCIFIEQKRGWADIFSGMPILGIKDSKKRVLEFLLGLDTINNEKMKNKIQNNERDIKSKWREILNNINIICKHEACDIVGLPNFPEILDISILEKVHIIKKDSEHTTINKWIQQLKDKYDDLKTNKPKVVDNYDELQVEMIQTEDSIRNIEDKIRGEHLKLLQEESVIKSLKNNIETIKFDLINNKDAARLRNLGSDIGCLTSKEVCPVCNQRIQDSLLPQLNLCDVMSIDDNIKHLDAQKNMLEFALESHIRNKDKIKDNIDNLNSRLLTLRRLAISLRNDLFSINDDLSETVIRKRIDISNRIENLDRLKIDVDNNVKALIEISKEWEQNLKDKAEIPKKNFSELDEKKIKAFERNFKTNLRNYGYKSVINLSDVLISRENYLPTIEGFDMKFDSSASDNIRAIWAFTIALLQENIEFGGNHPSILIFDEPDQHSIVISDMERFFNSIIDLNRGQVFVGITIKDSDTKGAIDRLQSYEYKIIKIDGKAFKKY